jgi:hypothetical protein
VKGVVSAECDRIIATFMLSLASVLNRIESNRLLTEKEFVFLQQIRLLCFLIEEKSALQTANK